MGAPPTDSPRESPRRPCPAPTSSSCPPCAEPRSRAASHQSNILRTRLGASLPVSLEPAASQFAANRIAASTASRGVRARSEEHTSELQSLRHLVCRLLLEKKKRQHATSCHSNRSYSVRTLRAIL